MLKTLTALLISLHLSLASANRVKVAMPSVTPTEEDNYLCIAYPLSSLVPGHGSSPIYITKFEADSDANKAHHIILQSCRDVGVDDSTTKPWDCRHHQTCAEGEEILFAWAKRAPPTLLPQDVTFKIDPQKTPYLVLQVHYVKPLDHPDSSAINFEYQLQPTHYSAGIYLLMRSRLTIPGGNAITHGDVNCQVRSEIHPFAFRTHAHQWGTVISGYKYDTRTNEVIEFAKGNPQWPQAFYPVTANVTLTPGDFFVARCTYNTVNNPKTTFIGSTAGDEMCNLYVMYYSESARFEQCFDEQSPAISDKLPSDSDVPPPRNPELEDIAAGRTKGDLDFSQPGGDSASNGGSRRKGPLDAPDLPSSDDNTEVLRLRMPGALPQADDSYICTSFQVWNMTQDRRVYIRAFEADATAQKAHHIILQRCDNPPRPPGQMWNCIHHATCNGVGKILYAWAKDAPPTILPDDVGFLIGENSHEHLVLQVHYSHPLPEKDFTGIDLRITDDKPSYSAGILLMWLGNLNIPPHQPSVHGDVNCMIQNLISPLYFFAYRTHAHSLSTVITGYKYHDGRYNEFARGDPQKPQTFYPMHQIEEVNNGDVIAARCTYNTTLKDTATQIGSTAGDEMCNLYIMFYTSSDKEDFKTCEGPQIPTLIKALPPDSDVPIQMLNKEFPQYFNNGQYGPNEVMPPKEKKQYGSGGRDGKRLPDAGLYTVPNWPPAETSSSVGQPTGIALDNFNNPVIFHRGDRVWDGSTFKSNNVYAGDMKNPIPQNTVLTLDKDSGKIINAWGAGMFFLPHMITVDGENNVWLTDVAMHQVFQFPPYGGKDRQPNIVLGQPFQPGSDDLHYCKPTSVAVMSNSRTFFVADGYCNSRIIQYSYEIVGGGHHNVTKLNSWGVANGAGLSITRSPYSLNVPHGLTLAEDKNLICVADRENGRVQCFKIDSGKFDKSIQPSEFGSTIYSVAYAKNTGQLYAIGGPENFGALTGKKTQGYIVNIDSGSVVNTFNSAEEGFKMPHDVAVTADGNFVYVVEIQPFKIWKLSTGKPSINMNSASSPNLAGNSNTGDNIMNNFSIKTMQSFVPQTTLGLALVIASVCLTCLFSLCVACRRCRKRGKGKVVTSAKKKDGKLDLGDLLGRSKDGFRPLKTEEDDAVLLSSDSDVEDFSVPLHA